MVIATHIILVGYGHWVPNDPRGSHSKDVYIPHIAELGPLRNGPVTASPSSLASHGFYKRAHAALHHAIHWFSPEERDAIRDAFTQCHKEYRLTSYACAVLPNHIHILVRRHALRDKEIHALLKKCASDAVKRCGVLPAEHPVFSAGIGTHFRSTPAQMYECVRYIMDNFPKHNLPMERYDFVREYNGWQ